MSYLKKLFRCQCGCVKFKHEFKPERWICVNCGTICSEIPQCDLTKYYGTSSGQKELEKDDNFKKDS